MAPTRTRAVRWFTLRRLIKWLLPGSPGANLALTTAVVLLRQRVQWILTAEDRRKAQRLRSLRNRHWGQRCFVLGNGPSLTGMDLQPLRREYSFGCNRIYLLFPALGFTTTYFSATDLALLRHYGHEIEALRMPKFLVNHARSFVADDPQTFWIPLHPRLRLPPDPFSGLYVGRTVLHLSLQLAYYMGFQQVILIGVDHRYHLSSCSDTVSMMHDHNRNHFSEHYMAPDFPYQYVSPEQMALKMRWWEVGYEVIRDFYHQDGREILDATVNGGLTVFPKVAFADLF